MIDFLLLKYLISVGRRWILKHDLCLWLHKPMQIESWLALFLWDKQKKSGHLHKVFWSYLRLETAESASDLCTSRWHIYRICWSRKRIGLDTVWHCVNVSSQIASNTSLNCRLNIWPMINQLLTNLLMFILPMVKHLLTCSSSCFLTIDKGMVKHFLTYSSSMRKKDSLFDQL